MEERGSSTAENSITIADYILYSLELLVGIR